VLRLYRSVLLAAALVSPLAAQSQRDNLLVSAQWLSEHLKDPNLVILHMGDRAGYDTAHVEGARWIDFRGFAAPSAPGALTLELPPADSLRAALIRLGISDNSRIVVYPTSTGGLTIATRLILTLDHAGFGESTSLLDGGLRAWRMAGYPTTAAAPTIRPGALSPLKVKAVTVSAEYVRDNIGKPGTAVVDGRAAAFYDGVSEGGPQGFRRRGHIKGAGSAPYNEIANENGELKSPDQLTAMFAKAGVKPGDTVIGYCHIGQQATGMLFAARTLGYKVMLYDGSFEDWARRDWPVAVPPAGK
jgi:thiosulfate/3-mercaptopyruvate sulfurtransferase